MYENCNFWIINLININKKILHKFNSEQIIIFVDIIIIERLKIVMQMMHILQIDRITKDNCFVVD